MNSDDGSIDEAQSIDSSGPSGTNVPHQCVKIASDPDKVIEFINKKELQNYRLGIVFIVVALTTWIVGLELVNTVLKGDDYNKPWMFAIITGSCFSLYLLPDIYRWVRGIEEKPQPIESEHVVVPEQLTGSEIVVLAVQIAAAYFSYNLFVMESLQFTSASNQTVLSSTTSIFTLVLGVLIKVDKLSWRKVFCVGISTVGVFLVNLSESVNEGGGDSKFQPSNPVLGNLLAIGGALMFSLYLLVMKVKCGTGNKTTNERRLFGYVGLITFVSGIPILAMAHYWDLERFEFPPPSKSILVSVLANGVFSVISDYCIILSMLLTSPLVTSLSLTSAIPITIFIDFVILYFEEGENTTSKDIFYILGITSILASVLLINLNITTENELIGQVIETNFEDAIRNDEVLSPVFSPYLEPEAGSTPRLYKVGTSGSEIMARLSPRLLSRLRSPSPRPSSPLGQLDNFDLNSSNENKPLKNNPISNDYTSSEQQRFLVHSGPNHTYQINLSSEQDL